MSNKESVTASEIERTLRIFHEPGDVVEIRFLEVSGRGRPYTIAGCFDDFAKAAAEVARWETGDPRFAGVYHVLNVVNPALLARSNNQLESYPKATTTDHDILRRRWLYIDLDPRRPSGISSSDAELKNTIEASNFAVEVGKQLGFYEPIISMSGNGCHVMYPIDFPNNSESDQLVARLLGHFSDNVTREFPNVLVDQSVKNAARIARLYGTTARKGKDMPDRPHRRSHLLYVPDYLEPESLCQTA
ncbi:MAG: hypothetical protein R3E01_22475 [Pirellulaceae bacterium]